MCACAAQAALDPAAWARGGRAEAEVACGVNGVGDCCALHGGGDTLCFPVGKNVGIWAASRGERVRSLAGHTDDVWCVTVEGDVLASGSKDKSIRLWSLGTGACTGVLEGHTSYVYGLSLRGDLLFSGSLDKSVRWWSLSGKACTAVWVCLAGSASVPENPRIVPRIPSLLLF